MNILIFIATHGHLTPRTRDTHKSAAERLACSGTVTIPIHFCRYRGSNPDLPHGGERSTNKYEKNEEICKLPPSVT